MCESCHRKYSDQEILDQTKKALSNPQFEIWNWTSVGNVAIGATGFNGPIVRDLCMELIQQAAQSEKLPKNLREPTTVLSGLLKSFQEKNIICSDKTENYKLFCDLYQKELQELGLFGDKPNSTWSSGMRSLGTGFMIAVAGMTIHYLLRHAHSYFFKK